MKSTGEIKLMTHALLYISAFSYTFSKYLNWKSATFEVHLLSTNSIERPMCTTAFILIQIQEFLLMCERALENEEIANAIDFEHRLCLVKNIT